jgi:predicted PurR-regulated permease PerM
MIQEHGGIGGASGIGGAGGGNFGRDWRRLRDMGIATGAWIAVTGVLLWVLAHIVGSLLLFIVAAILAYALSPAVKRLERFMARGVAIGLVYLGILTTLSGLIYLIVITAVGQVSMLLKDVQSLLAPGPNGAESPLVATFKAVGLTDAQIQSAAQRMLDQVQGLTGDAVAVAASVVDAVVRTVLVGVLSIYLLKDGPHAVAWLRANTPIAQRPRIVYFVDTLDTVVGGYIRGQLTLSAIIGMLVGGGMWLFHVPYAVLLGVLAFVFEFVPIVGVFISGAICVLLALSVGWITAVLVLIYFIGVHFVEGDVVGPRIMSRAVGLHPAISILALLAGSELFGIWGALFAAPMAGLIQAVIRTIWLEWRESHPEQFPTGYTVAPDVRIIPVTHAEAPTPLTVEAEASPQPAGPMHPEAVGDDVALEETLSHRSESVANWENGAQTPAAGEASETLAELAPVAGVGAAPAVVAGCGDKGGFLSGELVGAGGAPSGEAALPVGLARETEPDAARLLPDVSAWAPEPPVTSIYDRFSVSEPHPMGSNGDGRAAVDGDERLAAGQMAVDQAGDTTWSSEDAAGEVAASEADPSCSPGEPSQEL